MPYTPEQLTALSDAIAQGVLTVEYADKKVTYRSLAEMKEILYDMKKDLGLAPPSRRYAAHSKGL